MTRTKSSAKIINLALQGGGSHGAFTWGVLDRLLDSGKIRLDGISGTSAGAVNAVALAHAGRCVERLRAGAHDSRFGQRRLRLSPVCGAPAHRSPVRRLPC